MKMKATAKQVSVNGPITTEWLRSLGCDAIKEHDGTFSETKAILLMENKSGRKMEQFWLLEFQRDANGWIVFLSAHEEYRHLALKQLATVHSREDVCRVMKVFGLPLKAQGE